MLPEEWRLKTIGEVADVKGGKRLPKGYQLTDENTGFPYIRVTDMFDGGVDVSSIKYVPEEIAPKISRYRIGKDDIFITVAGTLGLIGEIPEELDGANLTENADKLTNLKCNKRFLLEVLRSPIVQKPIDAEKTQNAQPKLALTRIKEFLVPVPPLPEQKKIAQILSTWDQAITATERLLENSQQRKKGLMQQLLTGKKRLPGFEGQWEELPLLKLADYVKGYTYKSNEYSEVPTDTGFLTLKSLLRGGGYSKEGLKYLKTEIDDKFLVKEGDIVFAVTDITRNAEIVGAPLLVPDLRLPQVAISMDMVKLVVKQGVVPKFLYYALKRSPARNFMRSRASGSTVLHLDVRGSKKLRLPIPKDTREQEAISEVLTIADQEIEALSQRLVWLKHEKKALMQQLLTGKRRVNVETEAA